MKKFHIFQLFFKAMASLNWSVILNTTCYILTILHSFWKPDTKFGPLNAGSGGAGGYRSVPDRFDVSWLQDHVLASRPCSALLSALRANIESWQILVFVICTPACVLA